MPEGQTVRLKVTGGTPDSPLVEIHLPDSKDGSVNFDLSTELDLFPLSPSSQPVSPARSSNQGVSNGETTNGEVKGEILAQNIASLKTLLAPNIPPEGQYFDVNVTFAVSPSSFVVQPYNEVITQLKVWALTISFRVISWRD